MLLLSHPECLRVLGLCSANRPDSMLHTQLLFATAHSPLKPLCWDFCSHCVTNIPLAKLITRLLIAKVCGCFSGLRILDRPLWYIWYCRQFFPSWNPFFWVDLFACLFWYIWDIWIFRYMHLHLCWILPWCSPEGLWYFTAPQAVWDSLMGLLRDKRR